MVNESEQAGLPEFWKRWMSIGALYGVLTGLSLVAVAFSRDASDMLVRMVFWPHPETAGPVTLGAQQAIAVSGALTAGWGTISWFLRPGPVPEPAADRRAGRALTVGLLLWFAVDSAASVWLGGGSNVIGNVTFLVALLPPSLRLLRSK